MTIITIVTTTITVDIMIDSHGLSAPCTKRSRNTFYLLTQIESFLSFFIAVQKNHTGDIQAVGFVKRLTEVEKYITPVLYQNTIFNDVHFTWFQCYIILYFYSTSTPNQIH